MCKQRSISYRYARQSLATLPSVGLDGGETVLLSRDTGDDTSGGADTLSLKMFGQVVLDDSGGVA